MEEKKKGTIWKSAFLRRFLLVFLTVFICSNMTVTAYARTLVYIQCSVDLSTWEILTSVIHDEYGLTSHSAEIRRVDKADLEAMANNSSDVSTAAGLIGGLNSYIDSYGTDDPDQKKLNGNVLGAIVSAGEENRVLSFPSEGQSESVDMEKALEVNDKLIYGLNEAFSIWCENNSVNKTTSLSDFRDKIVAFLGGVHGNTYTITDSTGTPHTYDCCVEKGYPGEYVNWGMLVFEALNNIVLEGDEAITSVNVYSSTPSQLERVLVSVFGSILDNLRSILGLWSMDDLLFNKGLHGSGYVGGVFPKNWESTVWALFLIMEVFAAMILMFGLINNILKKALSTMNTVARMHAMAQVQDLIVCAIALSLLPVILRVLLTLSKNFTDMVTTMLTSNASATPEIKDMVTRFGAGSGTLAGIIAQFLFFGVQVYFNFFYALRALTVAVLIVIAPIMVAMITVSDSRKQSTIMWAKELAANILIQPIHAFIMAVILLLPNSSHGFDNLIALYALIPFTSMIKSLFFGSSGGWMENAAMKAKSRMTGTLAGGALAAGGALVSGGISALSARAGGGSSGGSSESNSSGSSSNSSGEQDSGQEQKTPQGTAPEPSTNTGSDAGKSSKPSLSETIASSSAGKYASEKAGKLSEAAHALQEKMSSSSNPLARGAASAVPAAASFVGKGAKTAGGAVSSVAKGAAQGAATFAGGAFRAIPGAMLAGAGGTLSGAAGGNAGAITNLGNRLSQDAGRKPYTTQNNEDNPDEKQGNGKPKESAPSGGSETRRDSMGYPSAIQDPNQFAKDYVDAENEPGNYLDSNPATIIPQKDGKERTEFDEDTLKDMGVSNVRRNKENGSSSARFDFAKMSAHDSANARMMLDMARAGTPEEKAALKNMGINDLQPVMSSVNGQRQVTGMAMDFDAKKYAQATGARFGRGLSVTAPPNTPPQMMPNIASSIGKDVPASDARRAVNTALEPQPAPSLEPQQAPLPEQPPIPTSTQETPHQEQPPVMPESPVLAEGQGSTQKMDETLTRPVDQGIPSSGQMPAAGQETAASQAKTDASPQPTTQAEAPAPSPARAETGAATQTAQDQPPVQTVQAAQPVASTVSQGTPTSTSPTTVKVEQPVAKPSVERKAQSSMNAYASPGHASQPSIESSGEYASPSLEGAFNTTIPNRTVPDNTFSSKQEPAAAPAAAQTPAVSTAAPTPVSGTAPAVPQQQVQQVQTQVDVPTQPTQVSVVQEPAASVEVREIPVEGSEGAESEAAAILDEYNSEHSQPSHPQANSRNRRGSNSGSGGRQGNRANKTTRSDRPKEGGKVFPLSEAGISFDPDD